MGGENKLTKAVKDRDKESWTPSPEALLFLEAYVAGPAAGNVRLASKASGFSEQEGYKLMKMVNLSAFAVTMRALGINKPYLAHKLRQAMETGTPREILNGVKLSLEAMGEVEKVTGKVATPQTFNAPVMIIHGATDERMRHLFKTEKVNVNPTPLVGAATGADPALTEDGVEEG